MIVVIIETKIYQNLSESNIAGIFKENMEYNNIIINKINGKKIKHCSNIRGAKKAIERI
jgi:hypothetical protein